MSAHWAECEVTSAVVEEGVTYVGAYSFAFLENLGSVVLADSVKSLGEFACSGCYALRSVESGKGLRRVGRGALYGCRNLPEFPFSTVEYISEEAFKNCFSLTSVDLPHVTGIGAGAFHSCTGIGHAALSGELLRLEDEVFCDCLGMTSVSLPDGLERIGDRVFFGCSSLTEVTLPDSLRSIGDNAFRNNNSLIMSRLPDGLQTIGASAFENCGMSSVTIPDSVEAIGEDAFRSCQYLTSLWLPADAGSIMTGSAFMFCGTYYGESNCTIYFAGSSAEWASPERNLNVFNSYFNRANKVYNARLPAAANSGGICGDQLRWLLSSDGTLTISGTGDFYPEAVKGWFDYSNFVRRVVVEEGVTDIGANAFANCVNLTEARLPESLQSIESNAFLGCRSLRAVRIPSGVKSIGEQAFRGSGLTGITLPAPTERIGARAFAACADLESVTLSGDLLIMGEEAFACCDSLRSVSVPGGTRHVGEFAFASCGALTAVTLCEGVETVGTSAFNGCIALRQLYLPASLTGVGLGVWAGTAIKSVFFAGEKEALERFGFSATDNRVTVGRLSYQKAVVLAETALGAWYDGAEGLWESTAAFGREFVPALLEGDPEGIDGAEILRLLEQRYDCAATVAAEGFDGFDVSGASVIGGGIQAPAEGSDGVVVCLGQAETGQPVLPAGFKAIPHNSMHASCLHNCSSYVPKSLDHASAWPAEFCAI